MSVDGGLWNLKFIALHDVIQALPFFKTGGNNRIHFVKFFFVQGNTFPSFGKKGFVGGLGGLGVVQLLLKSTMVMAFITWIADKRRFQKQRTAFILSRCSIKIGTLDRRRFYNKMFFNFLWYSCLVFSDSPSDCLKGHTVVKAVLNFEPIIKAHVFVFFQC